MTLEELLDKLLFLAVSDDGTDSRFIRCMTVIPTDDLQILPQLSSVEFRSGNSLISPETWQLLQDIQEARGVSIHMKMP